MRGNGKEQFMKQLSRWLALGFAAVALTATGCVSQPTGNSNSVSVAPGPTASPSLSASPSPNIETKTVAVTLPVLDALFSDEAFKAELKSKLQLNEAQINSVRTIASDEVARLRKSNAEQEGGSAEEARDRAAEAIRNVVGDQKSAELFALVREHWLKGSEELEAGKETKPESMSEVPNAVPKDTRIVVNIPGYRMDVFANGSLVKTYKIGIGYPEFPLPQGLRKAQTIIFNPTWTPPDSPWVATMKDVTAGEKIEAGSKLNPLGPIKIPIGMPSLIHGGKSPAKLGGFASHGCVGLTNAQVKDFAKVLAHVAGTEISDQTLQSYLKDNTKTKVVKLKQMVPVELRYETIVVEDGKLHIHRDVYDQDTNTEENLRAVLEANGSDLEKLSAQERAEVMNALNAMSTHPKKMSAPVSNDNSANSNSVEGQTAKKKKKPEAGKKILKNQKEVVIEISSLVGKGYPAPVDLDTGSGKPATAVAAVKSSR
jgi:lipoprotein-anchoring transpeptidase ErfK/SrfK